MRLKNRLIMAPMGIRLARNGRVTEEMIAYYEERAKGGVGAVTIEATFPRSEGYISPRTCIGSDEYIPGLKSLTKAIHRHGAKAILQLNAHRGRFDDIKPLSPSPTIHPWNKGLQVEAASVDYLKRLVVDFGEGTRRTRESGFDGVMIHGAHGYLACEFLSPLVNRRSDEYGGSLENRARFSLELVRAAREKVGRDYPVMFRLSASERLPGGFSVEEAASVCKMLEAEGIDAIDVVSGFMESYYWAIPCMRLPRGCNLDLAGVIKKAVKIPVTVAGRINNPRLAEEILEQGKADFVTVGRALIADPEFPRKAREGREKEIRPCLGCLDCLNPVYREKKPHVTCSVNPAAGLETAFKITPAPAPKKVLVIGGGPAGMETARVVALRGHKVTLWEKKDVLGGKLNLAVLPPHKEEIKGLTEYYQHQLKKLGVKVELGKEADLSAVRGSGAEVVVVATGARPALPPVPGIQRGNVVTSEDVLAGRVDVGDKVVIIGGGVNGCETAEFLVGRGKKVTIVEILDDVAGDVYVLVKWPLVDYLKSQGVEVLTGARDEKITDDGLLLTDRQGRSVELKADTIVVAAGAAPDRKLAQSLEGKVAPLYVAGDSVKPGRIWDAVHAGAAIGLKI